MHPATRIRIRGCLTHCHSQEIRFLRLSQANKDFYISLLNLGLSKDTILKRYCNSHQFNTLDSKVTTLQDLRNLERIYVNSGLDRNKTDVENVRTFLERSNFRGFSFDGLTLGDFSIPVTLRSKQFKTENQDTVIVYESNDMLKDFEEHPTMIFVDGTHGTNRSRFSLISILVLDSRGEGTPVMQVVGSSESRSVLAPAFRILKEIAPNSIAKVKVMVSDMNHAFMNAWEKAVPEFQIKHIVCSWHLLNAWKKKLLPQNSELYEKLCQLQLILDKEEFQTHYLKLRHD
ncbi:hypothetical protein TCAL_13162 [Tigriopus californicus]|uniref:ZSWIM1/3 RNaseH-like domain-containing protein n=1 Tax=Tigriopus californicus TaxID=6832 RepID=A0A553PS31_TIGCA|nr:hypothetical protein TCAL_13162 [Tigriopus californicus]